MSSVAVKNPPVLCISIGKGLRIGRSYSACFIAWRHKRQ